MLQVPQARDFDLVVRYVIEKFGKPTSYSEALGMLGYSNGMWIHLTRASNEWGLFGLDCPIFLIERDHDPIIPGVYGYDPKTVEEEWHV